MNREPGETTEQWNARAAAKYQQALAAVEVESRRLGLDGWRFPPGTYPMLDPAYDERADAANAVQRESPATQPG
jgi:hypothetical protein